MEVSTILLIGIIVFAIFLLSSTIKIVPQRSAYIVERLGKYHASLQAGLHILIPFIDKIHYKHTLKEQATDVDSQVCITKDNVSVEVDGILYLQVIDPKKASYGIDNYRFAATQIAQTTMRSIIGKMELDKTFEERDTINTLIVEAVDKASDPWGVKVSRYEVKNITPPQTINDAMEKQMRAEREKRATIAESEGQKLSKINVAEGDKQQLIKNSEAQKIHKINVAEGNRQELISNSEGERQKRINEAEGKAVEIREIAKATAEGIDLIAKAIGQPHGLEAVNLRVAEQYIAEFGKLAKENNSMIIPGNMSDMASMIAAATKVVKESK